MMKAIKTVAFVFILSSILLAFLLSGRNVANNSAAFTSQHRVGLLGTVITISIHEAGESASDIFDEIFSAIEDIDTRMGVTNPDSQVSRINVRAGVEPVKVSDDVFYVITLARQISEASGGTFDLSIGPLVSLWGIGSSSARVPSDAEILEAEAFVDYRNVLLNPAENSVYLKNDGMSIDLGAIAKGYAGDVAAEILRRHEVTSAILDLGGDIVALGSRPDGEPWRIGVRTPIRGGSGIVGVLRVRNSAIVTSGGYERYFEKDGVFYHHILDPDTGRPADSGLLSVTVISGSAVIADMLSTAAFVMGYERGRALVENHGADAIFITDDKTVHVTDGIKDFFTLTNDEFFIPHSPDFFAPDITVGH